MKSKSKLLLALALGVALALGIAACGGGGSGGGEVANSAPVADAGPDRSVKTGSLVTLDGSASSDANNDNLTFSWSFISNPAQAVLYNATTPNPSFMATVDGDYILSLVVNDGIVDSIEDLVMITAMPNTAPVADAGPDQKVSTGSRVILDGSASLDANDDTLTYSWSMTSVPPGSGAALSNATVASSTFTPDLDGSYVLSLVVNDGSADSGADTVTITAFTPPNPLPDTGQKTCYDSLDIVTVCRGTGQDAEYYINPMSFTDNGDGTVTDDVTGLMWQQQDDNNTYNWYEASGTYEVTYNPSSADVCGSLTTGGYSDWRLPTKKELMGIMDYGTYYPTIVAYVFLNTQSYYWSSTIIAYAPGAAWGGDFSSGGVGVGAEWESGYVRCVRGAAAPTRSFTDNNNGTVTDDVNGLMWQQEDDNAIRTWQQALDYCNNLTLAAYTDWLLPNIKELESITDDTADSPAIDTSAFLNTISFNYWSSTTTVYEVSSAWFVNFGNGFVGVPDFGKSDQYYVRCVRR